MTNRRRVVVKGRRPDSSVSFDIDVRHGKVWVTCFDCPYLSEAILTPAQAESVSGLLARAAQEARSGGNGATS